MKTLTVREAVKILSDSHDDIDCTDQFTKFFNDIMTVLTDHFGGTFDPKSIRFNKDKGDWTVDIKADENLPEGETVYDRYDRQNKL